MFLCSGIIAAQYSFVCRLENNDSIVRLPLVLSPNCHRFGLFATPTILPTPSFPLSPFIHLVSPLSLRLCFPTTILVRPCLYRSLPSLPSFIPLFPQNLALLCLPRRRPRSNQKKIAVVSYFLTAVPYPIGQSVGW